MMTSSYGMERAAIDWIDQVAGTLCTGCAPRTPSPTELNRNSRGFSASPFFTSANSCPLKNLRVKRLLAGNQKIVVCSGGRADLNVMTRKGTLCPTGKIGSYIRV